MNELSALRKQIPDGEIQSRARLCDEVFEVQSDCSKEEFERAARTSVALDRLVEAHQLGSMAPGTSQSRKAKRKFAR